MISPGSRCSPHPLLVLATFGTILVAACGTHPQPSPGVPERTLALEAPPPPPPPPQAEAPDKLEASVKALGRGDYNEAHARLLEVVELCGGAPLGQQALLLIAAAELDPRNPDPRRSLAAESTSLLLGELDSTSWARQLAESFYLIGRKLGARQLGAEDTEALELGWLFRHGSGRHPQEKEGGDASALMDEDSREWAEVESAASETDVELAGTSAGRYDTVSDRRGSTWSPGGASASPAGEGRGEASLHCQAVWTAPSNGIAQRALPSLPGSSYPAQVTALRRRVRELEDELERIRRIVTEQ